MQNMPTMSTSKLDFKLMLMTIPKVLSGDGIFEGRNDFKNEKSKLINTVAIQFAKKVFSLIFFLKIILIVYWE